MQNILRIITISVNCYLLCSILKRRVTAWEYILLTCYVPKRIYWYTHYNIYNNNISSTHNTHYIINL
jgi:hypothetical protein